MSTLVAPCWCGEKKAGEKKHRRAGEDACQASKDDRRAYDKRRKETNPRDRSKKPGKWYAGTPILIEEVEEL